MAEGSLLRWGEKGRPRGGCASAPRRRPQGGLQAPASAAQAAAGAAARRTGLVGWGSWCSYGCTLSCFHASAAQWREAM